MTPNLIPTLSSGAPWQIPLPGDVSPIAKFGVTNPTLSLPAVGASSYGASQSKTYSISTSLAVSLGFASYFRANVQGSAQYCLCENIRYQPTPLPAGTYDPNGVVQNLYVGYGYRIVFAFVSASATASSSISDFAAQVQVNGASLYAQALSLGFSPGSVLDQDVNAINDIFTTGSGFTVDSYAKYAIALAQLNNDFSSSKNLVSISPTLVGADVAQSAITLLSGLDYPSSVVYALNQVSKGRTLDQATQSISTQKLPAVGSGDPAIALDQTTIAAVYSLLQQFTPTNDPKGLANAIKGLG